MDYPDCNRRRADDFAPELRLTGALRSCRTPAAATGRTGTIHQHLLPPPNSGFVPTVAYRPIAALRYPLNFQPLERSSPGDEGCAPYVQRYSALTPAVRQRRMKIALRCTRAGFDNGLFGIKMFQEPMSGEIHIIEITPRMCPQFVDLIEKVNGINTYEFALAIAAGT